MRENSRFQSERTLGEEGFEQAFRERLGRDVPETLNGDHRLLVVGSQIDDGTERIIKYLSDKHGMNINAATFQYFRSPDGKEFLARVFLIEPSAVELHSRIKGTWKRKPPLTYEELESLARESGVHDLYRHAVSAFGGCLQRHTTRSTIAFTAHMDGSRKVVVSLLPGESSAVDGLGYQLYKHRFALLSGLSVAEVEGQVPESHDHWVYSSTGGPDWEGFQGYIKTPEEIDRLAASLSGSSGGT